MNFKLIAALVTGLCFGFGAALLVKQPQARAADAGQKWEYKATYADSDHLDLEQVNKDGYEFVAMSATGGKDMGCIVILKRPSK